MCPSVLGNLYEEYWRNVIKVTISGSGLSEALYNKSERQTSHANDLSLLGLFERTGPLVNHT